MHIDARVHAPTHGQPMSAGYFTLMNHGSEAVTVVGIALDPASYRSNAYNVGRE